MTDKTKREWTIFLSLMTLACFIAIVGFGLDALYVLTRAAIVTVVTAIVRGIVALKNSQQDNVKGLDQIITKCDEAIRLNPEDSLAYFERAGAYSRKGDERQAIIDYTKAIELKHQPLNVPYTNRGNCYQSLGEYDKAIEDYNEAIRLDSNYALAYYNCSHAYKELGNEERAMANIRKALELVNEPILEQAFKAQLAVWEGKQI